MYFRMGEKYGLQIVKRMPFHAFFKERVKSAEGRPLLRRMQALEVFQFNIKHLKNIYYNKRNTIRE